MSDRYNHNVICELLTIHLNLNLNPDHNQLKRKVLTVIAAKMTMDGRGYCSLKKLSTKNTLVWRLEQELFHQYCQLPQMHAWIINHRFTDKPLGSSFRYLFRYFTLLGICCRFDTFIVAVMIMQQSSTLFKNMIKYARIYRLFYDIVQDNDEISIKQLINELNESRHHQTASSGQITTSPC